MTATTTTTTVSQEQLDRCHRIYDENRKEYFYQVESESDPTKEYEVRFIAGKGYTCSCPAGQVAFKNCKDTCKHVRWSKAHARAVKAEEAEQSAITALVNQGVSRETASRVIYAQGPNYNEQDIKQAQYLNQREPFSMLR